MHDDSGIAPAQSKNRDKVRISIVVHLFVISFSYGSKSYFCKRLSHLKISYKDYIRCFLS